MADPVTLGLVGAGIASSITGAIASNKGSYTKWRQSFDHSHKANIEDWNMQNEYNLPINQLKRLRQAGINPNFMLNSGSISSSAGSVSPASGAVIPQQNVGEAGVRGAQAGMQLAQMKSAIQNTDADTELKRTQAEGQQIQNNLDNLYGAGARKASIGLTDAQSHQIISLLRPTIQSLLGKFNVDTATAQKIIDALPSEIASNEASANLANTQASAIPTQLKIGEQNAAAASEQAHAATSQAKTAAKNAETMSWKAKQEMAIESKNAETARQKVINDNLNTKQALEFSGLLAKSQSKMYDALTEKTSSEQKAIDINNEITSCYRDVAIWMKDNNYDKAKALGEVGTLYYDMLRTQEEIKNIQANTEYTQEQKDMLSHKVVQGYLDSAARVTSAVGGFFTPFGSKQEMPNYISNPNTNISVPNFWTGQ